MLKRFIICILIIDFATVSSAQSTLELYPNINTIGVTIKSIVSLPDSTKGSVQFKIKDSNGWGNWYQGFEITKITAYQYGSCVFHTKPSTEYLVRVVATAGMDTLVDLTDTVTTRSEPQLMAPKRIFYVSPNGTGKSQDRNKPGELYQSLLNSLVPGDEVRLLNGVYYVGELDLVASGTPTNPINLVADSDSVIIDGAFPRPIEWSRVNLDPQSADYNMFKANLGGLNSNCVIANGKRLYPYRNILELSKFSSIRVIDANGNPYGIHKIGHSGFFRDGRDSTAFGFPYISFNNNCYIKFEDGSDTSGKSIQVSKQAWAFAMTNRHDIVIKGIHFRHFGAAKTVNYRCALFMFNCNNIWIDSCSFQYCDKGLYIKGKSSNNIIEHSRFIDDFSKLIYFQFKETGLDYQQLNNNYPNFFPVQARNVEPGRIYFDHGFTGRGNIIRYNFISGGCDGITCPDIPGDSTTSRHFDIHNNIFGPGSDDAFEVDGNAANIRIWENEMYGAANGISVASPCYGPVYIFNNVMHDFRKTIYQYVVNSITMVTDTVPASPLKLNAAYCDIPGSVYFLHNTVDAGPDSYGFLVQQPQSKSSWNKVVAKNNIFLNSGNHYSLWVRATDSIDFDYNLYFNPYGFSARKDRPNYGEYKTMLDVQTNILGNIMVAKSGIEKHGFVSDPRNGWFNYTLKDYHLNSNSTAIDRGIAIKGINDDFMGTSPDVGAFEYGLVSTDILENISAGFELFPNPANEFVNIRFTGSSIVYHFGLYDLAGNLLFEGNSKQREARLSVATLSPGVYVISVSANGEAKSKLLVIGQ